MKADVILKEAKCMGIRTVVGVPDSTLKPFCNAIQLDNGRTFRHYVAANEGAAIGLAVGEYLAEKRPSMVYLQNSGIGNVINPAVSIAHREVYGIPMLLVIGWRGEPGTKDEPQHVYQGRITLDLLRVMDIPYSVIDNATTELQIKSIFKDAENAMENNLQYAIVVKKGTFEEETNSTWENGYQLIREQALRRILENVYKDSYIVSTTGKISRELYEQCDQLFGDHDRLFMTVGGMGHASMIAYGIAQADSAKRIVCIDGDGAVMMHMGALAFIGNQDPKNLIHIIINNAAHESVGGMPTGFSGHTYARIAAACGYRNVCTVGMEKELEEAIRNAKCKKELSMIEVMVSLASRENLSRPKESAVENKIRFMQKI